MDMPLEFRALNALGLIEKPTPVNLPPHRALMIMIAAIIANSRRDAEFAQLTGVYILELLNIILRNTEFTDDEIIDIYSCLHECDSSITIPNVSELGKYRGEVRYPFHRSALSILAEAMLRVDTLIAAARNKPPREVLTSIAAELVYLQQALDILCKMIARSGFGPARREVISSLETLLSAIPEDSDRHLMLTGIIIQQKRSGQ